MSEQRPYDPAAELAVLASCLDSKDARIASRRVMLPGDFFVPVHEQIYTTMLALDREGRAVDGVTLRAAMRAQELAPAQLQAAEAVIVQVHGAWFSSAQAVVEHATLVHQWAQRRRLSDEGRRLAQRAMAESEDPSALAAESVTRLIGVRDAGAGDATAKTLRELTAVEDDEPSWVIPQLLERADRVMLTGSEGGGKSALSRQIVTCAAAGLHPFTNAVIPPVRAYILDVENKETQVRRQIRPLLRWLHQQGGSDPMERVLIDAIYPRRLHLTNDRDLSRVHQTIDAWRPDIVVLGPIYRMSPKALQTDDEAHPFLQALDTLTERGCALIVEAHAGHATEQSGKQTTRSLRPRGSSSLMGWPEFGLGIRAHERGIADLEPWRGHRESGRVWPGRMRRAPGNRWEETHPDDRGQDRHEDPPPDTAPSEPDMDTLYG